MPAGCGERASPGPASRAFSLFTCVHGQQRPIFVPSNLCNTDLDVRNQQSAGVRAAVPRRRRVRPLLLVQVGSTRRQHQMTQLASHDTSWLGAINAGIHGGHLPR